MGGYGTSITSEFVSLGDPCTFIGYMPGAGDSGSVTGGVLGGVPGGGDGDLGEYMSVRLYPFLVYATFISTMFYLFRQYQV